MSVRTNQNGKWNMCDLRKEVTEAPWIEVKYDRSGNPFKPWKVVICVPSFRRVVIGHYETKYEVLAAAYQIILEDQRS